MSGNRPLQPASPLGGRHHGCTFHITDVNIGSEGMTHDGDFHLLHGLAKITDYYLRGEGSEDTAVARNPLAAGRHG